MNSFIYDIPTKVYFGENQLGHLGEELGKYGEKVLLTFAPSLGHISAGNRRKLGARNPAKGYDFVSVAPNFGCIFASTRRKLGARNPAKAYGFVSVAPNFGRISVGNLRRLGEKAKSMI